MSDSLRPHEWQHTRPPCPSPTPRVHPNPCPLSRWCHPTISPSVVPFSSCPQSFPASGSFPMSQLFASGGQSTGVSASISVLPMNTQDWSPLGWTGWISLQFKGLRRVFSYTTDQKRRLQPVQKSEAQRKTINCHCNNLHLAMWIWGLGLGSLALWIQAITYLLSDFRMAAVYLNYSTYRLRPWQIWTLWFWNKRLQFIYWITFGISLGVCHTTTLIFGFSL